MGPRGCLYTGAQSNYHESITRVAWMSTKTCIWPWLSQCVNREPKKGGGIIMSESCQPSRWLDPKKSHSKEQILCVILMMENPGNVWPKKPWHEPLWYRNIWYNDALPSSPFVVIAKIVPLMDQNKNKKNTCCDLWQSDRQILKYIHVVKRDLFFLSLWLRCIFVPLSFLHLFTSVQYIGGSWLCKYPFFNFKTSGETREYIKGLSFFIT